MSISMLAETVDYGDLIASDSTQKFTLGTLYIAPINDRTNNIYAGNVYRYVKYLDADVSGVAGGYVCYDTTTPYVVNMDISDTSANRPAGVLMADHTASTSGTYGWILIHGYHDAVLVDNTIALAAGSLLYPSSVDGVLDEAVLGTNLPVAVLIDAISSGGTSGTNDAVSVYVFPLG